MIIAIDFDGTLCDHQYPEIGEEIPFAFRVCKKLQEAGHKLMLWTMRGNKPDNETLKHAVDWCAERGLVFWGVNENPEQKESGWSNSNKQYANIYIDDAAFGCPLITKTNGRPSVDWIAIEAKLVADGIIAIP